MFAGMLFFAIGQWVINFKGGMVFSPFFHYGMYSAPAEIRRDYFINVVIKDGDTLRGKDFKPPQWDKIQYTLHQAIASGCDTNFYNNQVSRLFNKAGLPAPDARLFINKGTKEDRIALYKTWLSKQIKHNGAQIDVAQGIYRYQTGAFIFLQPTDTLQGSNLLCH